MDTQKIIAELNKMLAQEHACAIRYVTHAACITGPYSEPVAARLKEISGDEVLHAEKLRDRIVTLGGSPTMDVSTADLKPAANLEEILAINIEEEKGAIASYTKILGQIPIENVILYKTIEEIIRDEQEHLEELENLRP